MASPAGRAEEERQRLREEAALAVARAEAEAAADIVKSPKPLKHARSKAELTALKQRQIQICLVATNVVISALIALKTFGII